MHVAIAVVIYESLYFGSCLIAGAILLCLRPGE